VALGKHQRATLRLLGWSVPGTIVFGVVHQLSLLAVAVVTVRLFLDGTITPGAAVALIVVLVHFLEPFVTLSELAPAVEVFRQALGRIRLLLDAEVLPEPATPGVVAPVAPLAPGGAAGVELRGVRFGYRPGVPVLDGIDLVVPAGSTTAIVGPSGSGKSTLLDLIARTADVDEGAILVDGADVRDQRLDDLLGKVAMVHQDVFLHDGTIRENVLDGRPDAADDAVRAACTAAQLDEVAARLPEGWDTRVGEGGDRLSGGERQRVSIARAILRGAPLLLLDEATSALDVRTEQALVAALAEHTAEHTAQTTTVVVAHRLSTIARADRIVFLENGRLVEQGTLAELLAADGRFAAYWRLRETAGDWVLGAEPVGDSVGTR
jgi:ABC-type multidrug transport system fused ATPase/permease subunit